MKKMAVALLFTLPLPVNSGTLSLCHNLQENITIQAIFIGNCGFQLSNGKNKLFIDFPYKSGAFGYMEIPDSAYNALPSDAFYLFTHWHADHFSSKVVRKKGLSVTGPPFVMGRSKKPLEIEKLNSLGNWKIQIFETKHQWALRHYSYLIEWEGLKFFFTGDAENIDVLQRIGPVDYLFTNPWFLLSILENPVDLEIAGKIILYHLRPEANVNNSMPNKVLVPNQGDTLYLSTTRQ